MNDWVGMWMGHVLQRVRLQGGILSSGDGISQVGVRANEWLSGDIDGTCLAVGMVARRDPFKW